MPCNGLPDLQQAVLDKLDWALSMRENDIDKESYMLFMGVMYSALYVFSAQGRISGVMDINYGQARNLLLEGYSTTDQFKTNQRWGLQPVTLSSVTGPLLRHYLNYIRPRVCKEDLPSDHTPLWLRYSGRPEEQIGTCVTAFFTRVLALHITTTAIRSLVETSMSDLHDKGIITGQQLLSVQAINGHTSAVAKDYYIHKERGNDVTHARAAFSHLTPEQVDVTEPQPLPPAPTWSPAPKPTPLNFGTAHPDYGSKSKRAQWTADEIKYIADFCTKKLEENPQCSTLVAQCRDRIMVDPDALPIFHVNHVLDSGRLRSGYRTWQSNLLSVSP